MGPTVYGGVCRLAVERGVGQFQPAVQAGLPLLTVAVLGWVAYRLVNMPTFADFLIAVEAEMAKVSWPTRSELFKASVVVIVVIIGLAVLLFGYDAFWKFLLSRLGVG